jgi:DNA replication and repair protein RecF
MLLTHLALTHFRNYRRLELDFDRPLILLQGQNAQGKTNLLEAIFMLATSKPVHAQQEREIVDWLASEEPIPFCRLAAQLEIGGRPTEIEIVLAPRGEGPAFVKQVKINGVPRRSMDLIGLLRAVLFLPADIELVSGSPGERRRYLDIALCQIDRGYCRALSAFQQVLTQRNSLLKQLRDQDADPKSPAVEAQLAFWDERLALDGAAVMARRQDFLIALEDLARARHEELSGGRELLRLHYLPSFNTGLVPDADFDSYRGGLLDDVPHTPADGEQIRTRFRQKLASRRSRELAAGVTLYGPHRDDLRFLANGRDLRTYGSRGQQRSAALAVKLAEVRAMTDATGSAPLLLLDDVMSELDAQRRGTLLAVLHDVPQAIVTTTDWDDFTPEFRRQAQLLTVVAGDVAPATG